MHGCFGGLGGGAGGGGDDGGGAGGGIGGGGRGAQNIQPAHVVVHSTAAFAQLASRLIGSRQ